MIEETSEFERCPFCGALVDVPCDEPPPDICEKAIDATYHMGQDIHMLAAPAAPVQAVPDGWRKLALQFDGQRMQALAHLRAMLQDPAAHADVAKAFLAAAPSAPQVPAVPQWLPIETAPTDTLVLLYGAKRSEMVVGMKHSRDGWVIDTPSEWAGMYPPTHWMKLPAAPGAPQPAEQAPLTVPQILELMPDKVPASYDGQLLDFARAIEAAHGIRAAGVKGPGNAKFSGGR